MGLDSLALGAAILMQRKPVALKETLCSPHSCLQVKSQWCRPRKRSIARLPMYGMAMGRSGVLRGPGFAFRGSLHERWMEAVRPDTHVPMPIQLHPVMLLSPCWEGGRASAPTDISLFRGRQCAAPRPAGLGAIEQERGVFLPDLAT